MKYERDFRAPFSKLIKRDGLEEDVLIFLKFHQRVGVAWMWNSVPLVDRTETTASER